MLLIEEFDHFLFVYCTRKLHLILHIKPLFSKRSTCNTQVKYIYFLSHFLLLPLSVEIVDRRRGYGIGPEAADEVRIVPLVLILVVGIAFPLPTAADFLVPSR